MDSFTLEKLEFDKVRQILARFCRCSLGREVARRITPSRRGETVRRWLEETSQMVWALRNFGPPPYGGITDIRPSLQRATPGGGATGSDFSLIAGLLEGAANVRAWAAGLDEGLNLVRDMALALPDFSPELAAIRAVVDGRGQVMDSASPALARTRREMETAQHRIHSVIYSFARQPAVSRILQNPTVTLHEDRFVLPVKAEKRHEIPGVVHRTSNTGATVFVEPAESVELNNRLVELRDDERREVARLLDELSIRIHARCEVIEHALHTLAQVDLVTAKAEYAFQFEFTAPTLTENGPILLHQVRHPLLVEQAHQQEMLGTPAEKRHAVVPIDVRLGQDFDILIITGSNTGGKTVALKTVGLAVVMNQSGLHIPCQRGSSLPIFREVMLDVGDEQSLEQSLSTFGAHIHRVKAVLQAAGRGCLVLLDELGSGTDPDEGGAIGMAILDELRRVHALAIITTHLSILKAYAINHDRVDNASVAFDTRTLRPTYHLLIGQPGESHAITVAAAIGLPGQLIRTARHHLHQGSGAFNRAIRATSASRKASEEARTEAFSAKLAAQEAAEEYREKLGEVKRLQKHFADWLATLTEMREGDEVFVPSMQKPGRLVRMEFNKQIALVNVGSVAVEVPLGDLMPSLGQEGVRQEIASLRAQIREQSRSAEDLRLQAQRLQEEYRNSVSAQRTRQDQYDRWVALLAAAKVGDTVAIAAPPGQGLLVELDLAHGRAKVETPEGEKELRVQELFPQSGPFGPHVAPRGAHGRRGGHGHPAPHGAAAQGPRAAADAEKDKPVHHRRPDSSAARVSRKAIMQLAPGQQVYVVPFHKRATLMRIIEAKDQAVVLAGAFEMTLPLSDLDIVRDQKDRPAGAAQAGGDARG